MPDATPPPPRATTPALSGRLVVRVLGGLFALALVAASAIWFGGRTPWRGRQAGQSRPDLSREDIAGQALVQVLHACLAELDLRARFDARLRVAIAANGSASLARAEVPQGGLAEACARRAPSLIRTRPDPDAAPAGLDVWFSSEPGADGSRLSRSGWAPAAQASGAPPAPGAPGAPAASSAPLPVRAVRPVCPARLVRRPVRRGPGRNVASAVGPGDAPGRARRLAWGRDGREGDAIVAPASRGDRRASLARVAEWQTHRI